MAGKFSGLATSDAPGRMTVIHPVTNDPLTLNSTGEECWIEAYPSQSKRGSEIDRELTTKVLRKRVQRMSAKDIDENVVAKLGMLTTGWKLALLNGEPLDVECTPENATELYTDVRWLRDQISTFVNDLGNFQPTPSGTS